MKRRSYGNVQIFIEVNLGLVEALTDPPFTRRIQAFVVRCRNAICKYITKLYKVLQSVDWKNRVYLSEKRDEPVKPATHCDISEMAASRESSVSYINKEQKQI